MANIAIGLVRMKVVAILLGPMGVGIAGLYMNLVQTASAVASLGIGTAGTRQIAAALGDGSEGRVDETRRALFWGALILSLLGALLFWLASGLIATRILQQPNQVNDVAWLSLGVALSVASGAQGAVITGMRRVADLARINIASAVISTLLSILALWLWGTQGIVAMVLAAPLTSFAIGHFYVARLGRPRGSTPPISRLLEQWRTMAGLGFVFMVGGLLTTLSQLAVRAIVQQKLGPDALGQFQAAWAVGMTYLGFVLAAMATDYYPRLTSVIGDREAAVRMVNEQTEVALLLSAPILLLMLGFAPWVLHILYSAEFRPAVDILRWQLLGDILKVISWPLGFVLMAAGAANKLMLCETLAMAVLVAGVWIGLPLIGVQATGVAFLLTYVVYLPLVWLLARRQIGFQWYRSVKINALSVTVAALAVDTTTRWSASYGATLATISAVVFTIFAQHQLRRHCTLELSIPIIARLRPRWKFGKRN